MKNPFIALLLFMLAAHVQLFSQTATVDLVTFNNQGAGTPQTSSTIVCYPLLGPIQYGVTISYTGFTAANISGFSGDVKVSIEGDYNVSSMNSWQIGNTNFETVTVDQTGTFSVTRNFSTLTGEDIYSTSDFRFNTRVEPLNAQGGVISAGILDVDNIGQYTVFFDNGDFDFQHTLQNFSSQSGSLYRFCNTAPSFDVSNSDCVAGYRVRVFNSDISGSLGTEVSDTDWEWNPGGGISTMVAEAGSYQNDNYYIVRIQAFNDGSNPSTDYHIYYSGTPAQTISVSPTSVTLCTGESQLLTASGLSGTYNWSPATDLSATSGSAVTLNAATVGSWTITVNPSTGSEPCIVNGQVNVVVNATPSISVNSGIFFCEDELPYDFNSEVQLTPAGLPGTYNWPQSCGWEASGTYDYINDGCDVNPSVQSHTGTKNNFKFTSSAGCVSNEVSFSYGWNESPEANGVVTDASCSYSSDGSIVISPEVADGPYTVLWSNSTSENSITGIAAIGSYTVTITDDDGCSASETFTVNSPLPISLNTPVTSDAPCSEGSVVNNLGSAVFTYGGGVAPYTISVDGSGFFNPSGSGTHTHALPSGTHSWNVKDANGCFAVLGSQPTFDVDADVTFEFANGYPWALQATCLGANDGAINLSMDVSGGTTPYAILYEKSPTASFGPTTSTTHNFTGLAANTNHLVTVTEQTNNCQLVTGFLNIGNAFPNPFTVEFNPVIEPGCTGLDDGALTADPSISAQSFLWSTGETTATITDLVDGGYSVTVTANGCQVIESTTLTADDDRWQQKSEGFSAERAEKVVTDDDGNVYVLGTFRDQAEFGTTTVSSNEQFALAYFLAKYDDCGNLLWVSYPEFGSFFTDFIPIDVEVMGSEVYAFFHTSTASYVDVDIVSTHPSSTGNTISGISGNFTLILELDASDGTNNSIDLLPEFDYPNNDDQMHDVENDGSDFYLGGHVDGLAQIYSYTFGNGSASLETNNTGNSGSTFFDIEQDESGNWLAVGTTDADVDFDGQSHSSALVDEGFVVRFNSSFVGQAIACTFTDECSAVALELGPGDGLLYIAGSSIDPSMNNMYVVAKNTSLVTQWTSTFDPSLSDATSASAADMVMDANGRIVVTGSFLGNDVSISSNGSSAQLFGGNQSNDLWVGAFAAGTGLCDWLIGAESQGAVNATALAAGATNSYVVGSFYDDLDFVGSEPTLTHSNQSTEAMFALRFGTLYTSGSTAEFYKTAEQNGADGLLSGVEANPNPTSGPITVTWTPTEGTATITVMDLSGRVVSSMQANAQHGMENVNLSANPAGAYFVTFTMAGRSSRFKLIKY